MVGMLQQTSCRRPAPKSYTGRIWNRTRPRALVQNQHTRELISARSTSHKHNNKDLCNSPGMRVTTRYINSTRVTASKPHQRPESPTVTFTWHASKYKVHKLHQRYILKKKKKKKKKRDKKKRIPPSGIYTLHFRHTRRHSGFVLLYLEPVSRSKDCVRS